MRKIIWLASYPKSGNTWMRALLTNFLHQDRQPAQINQFIGGPIASARFWFDEWVGVEASALSDEVIEDLRPGVYRCLVGEAADPHFLKVHDAWKLTRKGEALFPPEITRGVVYILRNPLDLAASCANHWGTSIEKAVENLCNPEFALARSHGALADQLRQSLNSWSGHLQSWLDESGLPVTVVRYEDLRSNTEKVFGDVLRFCGLEYDMERIKTAVTFADFSELRRQEVENGFREQSVHAPGQFFRHGQVNGWREELPWPLAQRLIAAHGEMMHRFGYLDENYLPT